MMRWKKNTAYRIRWAGPEDWKPAMEMIWRTFMRFEAADYTPEGVRNFWAFVNDGDLYQSFLEGKYEMFVALDGEDIIGAISVRCGNFISLLFVEEAYHRQGVGKALMNRMAEHLKNDSHEIYMTVKSAPYAVGFYKRLGFQISMPEMEIAGIRVTSMEKFL